MKPVRYYILFRSADGLEREDRVYSRPKKSYLSRPVIRNLGVSVLEHSVRDQVGSSFRTYFMRDLRYVDYKKYVKAVYVYEETI